MTNPRPIELLAPAGSLETFAAAVAAGADAVYIGAPAANARALARNLPVAEIAAMIDHAHQRGVRVYAAMNSLLKEEELASAAATVEMLAGLGIDALIIQDLGLYQLCRRFFPDLRLHASTLMGAHNSLAVRQFATMGFARVVLARELTLVEIAAIRRQCEVELEVFVHGAMCFSYSGLCLFSSYLGGKSSLRGRCVQPCRRAYRWPDQRRENDKAAYLFSMNDLDTLALLPELRRAGVGSVKIEGRMKSALYVDRAVRAYRRVIDALGDETAARTAAGASMEPTMDPSGASDEPPSAGWAEALAEGRALLAEAMGRRTGAGYLRSPWKDLVTPGHSGNIGHFLGKLRAGRGTWGMLTLRYPLTKGDRLRLHREAAGERSAFTVREMRIVAAAGRHDKGKPAGRSVGEAAAGSEVEVLLPVAAKAGDSLYKVDLAQRRRRAGRGELTVTAQHRRRAAAWEERSLPREIAAVIGPVGPAAGAGGKKAGRIPPASPRCGKGAGRDRRREHERSQPREQGGLPLWLRLDDPQLLSQRLPPEVTQVVLPLSPVSWPRLATAGKLWRKLGRRLVWALPPVIMEGDLPFYREKIAELRAKGGNSWQLGHVGQLLLFRDDRRQPGPAEAGRGRKAPGQRPPLLLHGDYTLNILNSMARQGYQQLGFTTLQAAIETDRANLLAMLAARRPKGRHQGKAGPAPLGLTIHGRPPLFTSRLDSVHFRYQVPFVSPREEKFVLRREHDLTLALAEQPFSLLSRAAELAAAGLAHGVVDLRHQKISRQELVPLLRQAGKPRRRGGETDLFNFLAGLD